MKKITRSLLAAAMAGVISFAPAAPAVSQPFAVTAYAHGHHGSGHHHGNGSAGGGGGSVHYYCNGHEAHLHSSGVCPYAGQTSAATAAKASRQNVSKSTVKKVQKKLNNLGYSCGKADGVLGAKTKKAVKQFKIDHGLKANCAIKKPVLRALGMLKK